MNYFEKYDISNITIQEKVKVGLNFYTYKAVGEKKKGRMGAYNFSEDVYDFELAFTPEKGWDIKFFTPSTREGFNWEAYLGKWINAEKEINIQFVDSHTIKIDYSLGETLVGSGEYDMKCQNEEYYTVYVKDESGKELFGLGFTSIGIHEIATFASFTHIS